MIFLFVHLLYYIYNNRKYKLIIFILLIFFILSTKQSKVVNRFSWVKYWNLKVIHLFYFEHKLIFSFI